jgi:peptidylprolyl isomerase
MRQAQEGDTVRVHYTGKFDNDAVFDSSEGREPMQFVIGDGCMIPGFEKAVIGMIPGELKNVKIGPEQAYGDRKEELVSDVEKTRIPPDIKPHLGDVIQVQIPSGMRYAVITKVTDSGITLDFNHPLAGIDLIFDIQLVEIV